MNSLYIEELVWSYNCVWFWTSELRLSIWREIRPVNLNTHVPDISHAPE